MFSKRKNERVCIAYSKEFRYPFDLSRNIKQKHNKEKFTCSKCGKEYQWKVFLTTHGENCKQSKKIIPNNEIEVESWIDGLTTLSLITDYFVDTDFESDEVSQIIVLLVKSTTRSNMFVER